MLALVTVLANVYALQGLQTQVPRVQRVEVNAVGFDAAIASVLSNYELNAGNKDNVLEQQVNVQSAEVHARLTKSVVMLLFALVLAVVVLGITMVGRR